MTATRAGRATSGRGGVARWAEAWAPALALLAGCSDAAVPPASSTVRDSVGVAIVSTPASAILTGPTFASVSDTLARIGSSADQSGADVLFRVAAARFLGDSGLVLLHAGTELRFYNAVGQLRSVTGRRGEGPGEYLEATGLRETPAGELAVWDARQARVSLLSKSGDFVRSRQLDLDGIAERYPGLGGIIPSARWQLLDEHRVLLFSYTFDEMPKEGTSRPRLDLVTVRLEDLRSDTLGTYGGIEQLVVPGSGGRVAVAIDPDLTHDALSEGTGHVYVGDGGLDRIDRFDEAGRLDLRIELPGVESAPPPHVLADGTTRLREQFEQWGFEGMNGVADRIARDAEAPAFRSLFVDDRNNLWVKWGQQPDPNCDLYAVFDEGGVLVGTVVLPAHDRVLAIRGDRMVLLHRSDLDVEWLAVYRLSSFTGG